VLTNVVEGEYNELANSLGEERGQAVQEVIKEAFVLFAPLARQDWLSWGGELLFSDMKEQVEREEQEEREAKLWEVKELEQMEKRESEKEVKCMAAEAWKVALGEA
jgi:hypothetical protein